MKPIAIIVLSLLLNMQTIFAKEFYNDSTHKCRTIKDTLTQTNVYITADVMPQHEGGVEYLNKKLHEIILDSIPNNYDGNFTVAFIVDKSGSVYGERIVKAPITKIGLDILTIVKALHWTPALCKGKKVTMLYVKNVNIDITENG